SDAPLPEIGTIFAGAPLLLTPLEEELELDDDDADPLLEPDAVPALDDVDDALASFEAGLPPSGSSWSPAPPFAAHASGITTARARSLRMRHRCPAWREHAPKISKKNYADTSARTRPMPSTERAPYQQRSLPSVR